MDTIARLTPALAALVHQADAYGLASITHGATGFAVDYGQSYIIKKLFSPISFNATYCESNPCWRACVQDSHGRTRRRRSALPNPHPEAPKPEPAEGPTSPRFSPFGASYAIRSGLDLGPRSHAGGLKQQHRVLRPPLPSLG